MKRTVPPVSAILDLWSQGYCAAIIETKLDRVPRKLVAKVVAQARSIRDPRAVLHHYPSGRVVGNLAKAKAIMTRWPEIRVVEQKVLP